MASVSNTPSKETPIYSPLKDSDEIRLLYLQPRSAGEAVQCSLKHVRLSEDPFYEALSYMWGPKILTTIEIDGGMYEVRKNLASALTYLRLADSERVLWVDALCINQNNRWERNHQVMQMGPIYENAFRVVIWLGPPNSRISLAFGWLSGRIYGLLDSEGMTAITALYSHQYWSRLWIIQEVILAKQISIQCGFDEFFPTSIPWTDKIRLFYIEPYRSLAKESSLCGTDEFLQQSKSSSQQILSFRLDPFRSTKWIEDVGVSIPVKLLADHLARLAETQESRPLLELFIKYMYTDCEEILDKVFGLHALTDKCCKLGIQVNYDLDWEDLCSEVLAHHLLAHLTAESDLRVSVSQEFNEAARYVHGKFEFLGRPPARLPTVYQLRKPGEHTIASRGYYGAHICFVSPSLAQGFDLDLPKVNSRLARSLRRAMVDHENYNPFLRLDIVWQAIGTQCHVEVSRSIMGSGISYSTETLPTIGVQRLQRWYDRTRERVLGRYKRLGCRLAFVEHGLICFVPENTQAGDLICHFRKSNVLAIVRLHETMGQLCGRLVGRAADLFDSSQEQIWDDSYLSNRWQLNEKQPPLWFFFQNFPTLQMMTRPSAFDRAPRPPPPPGPISCDRASHVFCSHAPV